MADATPMPGLFRSAFSGADNRSIDIGRVHLTLMALGYLALSGWHAAHGGAFDPISWAGGAAGVMAGGSAGLFIKKGTEPTA